MTDGLLRSFLRQAHSGQGVHRRGMGFGDRSGSRAHGSQRTASTHGRAGLSNRSHDSGGSRFSGSHDRLSSRGTLRTVRTLGTVAAILAIATLGTVATIATVTTLVAVAAIATVTTLGTVTAIATVTTLVAVATILAIATLRTVAAILASLRTSLGAGAVAILGTLQGLEAGLELGKILGTLDGGKPDFLQHFFQALVHQEEEAENGHEDG